tara:strand:+ start:56516 stop:57211 length:696 start_codon:yes stop_codon:yes gene_type:complete
MKISLTSKPKSPIIIEGFPGFGLVGTIATEFLIKHLNAKPIGKIWSRELLPMAAVHESKIVEPIGIFYAAKNNIVIIHALSGVKGIEWDLAEIMSNLVKTLNAKEIISLEGIGSTEGKSRSYYFSKDSSKKKKFEKLGALELKEGIIMGVTGALLLKEKNLTGIFVESSIGLADSKAAAKVVEILDKYLGLKVDYKPLLKAADEFEKKLKTIMEKSEEAKQQPTKGPSYFG